ncbi:MAG: helix-turn-helix transcriptional regulator [Novosphingobium sp.]|nr:helix-turn-helix transcriptional regulator [Novosphingobium sp.]
MAVRMDRSNDRLVAAFAAVLRERREAAGMTQEDLAERADVSARFISFLETGRRQPSLSALSAISSGLGVSMTTIVADLEERLGGDRPDPS